MNFQAFVIFENWNACCNFVQDHIKKPVFFANSVLTVHFVFQRLISEYTQVLDSLWDYSLLQEG